MALQYNEPQVTYSQVYDFFGQPPMDGDEWYNFKPELSDHITVLVEIDESTYEGGTHGDHHPFTWYHEFDGGRSWYTAGGHFKEHYTDDLFMQHILGGILYAIGRE